MPESGPLGSVRGDRGNPVPYRDNPLRGTAEIALKVGEVLNTHKMKKHFDLEITDAGLSFARKT